MISFRPFAAVAFAAALAACAETIRLETDDTDLREGERAQLTCTVSHPGGTVPVSVNCEITKDPDAAASIQPSPVVIRAPVTNGMATFTANAVSVDTDVKVTATWNAYRVFRDPSSTVTIVVRPPRRTGTDGQVTITVEPSVKYLDDGRYSVTYVIQATTSGSAADEIRGVDLTFTKPMTLRNMVSNCLRTDGTSVGSTALTGAGPATNFQVRCNVNTIVGTMTINADGDAQDGGTTMMIVFVSGGTIAITPPPTGPQ